MAQVTLRINGYAYTVGCQDGEEEHLQHMAGEVERRIEGIKGAIGQSGESRMLVMAALMMAQSQNGASTDNMKDMPGMEMSGSSSQSIPGTVSFPYGFPTPGNYRIFVQMKHGNAVETATFDANVQ